MEKTKLTLPDWLIHSKHEKHFIAVSGGVDSMVLLHLMRSSNLAFEVLHVNYHLRGEESVKDQLIIEQYCAKHKIKFHFLDANPNELNKTGVNLQNKAREIRYEWFESFTKKRHPLLLAHHQNDQIETFFINLSRKSGILGLSCMLAQDQLKWRPLLQYTKDEIYDFALANHLTWREDQSNASLKYTRNIWRNLLIPQLIAQQNELTSSILLLIKKFQAQRLHIERKIDTLYAHILQEQKMSIDQFNTLSEDEKVYLAQLFNLSSGQMLEWNKLVARKKGAKMILNNGIFENLLRERDHFYFTKNEVYETPIFKMEVLNQLPDFFDLNSIYLDQDLIKGEIKCRLWKIGDRLYPIGMKGSKLVSDIIKDEKIAHHQKQMQYVLCDDEQLLCCIGLKIDRRKIASKNTVNILKVSFS